MGRFVWKTWARLLALTSACYVFWSSLWGVAYRKFSGDFLFDAKLGPHGLIPSPRVDFFLKAVVNFPVFQIVNVILSLATILLEWPVPGLAGTPLHRSFSLRIVLYSVSSILPLIVYQSVDGAVFYAISCSAYAIASR
ncbi:hypothetical protein JCM10212_000328 [Sporobolomyces blumeae]